MVLHDSAPTTTAEEPNAQRNTRWGRVLFALYLLLYGIYVVLVAFVPEVMRARPFGSLNVAILYGFGLILTAILLSLLYGWICSRGSSTMEPRS